MFYRVIICGGRTELNYNTARSYIDDIFQDLGIDDAEIISGGCKGADKIGERFAEENDFEIVQFLPEWNKYGRAAGIKRNLEMVDYIKDYPYSVVIAFWNGESKGTKSTITQAEKFNIPVYIIDYSNRVLADRVLVEGITVNDNTLVYDFGNDTADDIITLTNTQIHSSKLKNNTYYYEYKINKKEPEHKNLLKLFKEEPIVSDFKKIIDIAIQDICATVSGTKIDYIMYPESHSQINRYIAYELADKLNADLIESKKQSAKNVEFDWDKFLMTFKGDKEYLAKFEKYINSLLKTIHSKEQISLTRDVPSRYRQYIKNFLTIDGADILTADRIILLDDIISTGTTISSLLSLIRSLRFDGDIIVFSLINSR